MRWTPRGRSQDLEDRRSVSTGGRGFGGGRIRLGLGGVVVVFVLSVVFGQDFFSLLDGGSGVTMVDPSAGSVANPARDAAEERTVQFVSFVLDDAQQTWTAAFQSQGREYRRTKLVLFRDAVDSACGFAQSAMGPFYCPGDQSIFIDLAFYDELHARFGAPGDFAQAYVLTHEIGHHVQNLLGIEQEVRQMQRQQPGEGNALSVKMELQADCFAGVWANSTTRRELLEQGDLEEGLAAAASVGDDRIQMASRGHVVPESFTHGSSQQRMEWFKRGMSGGEISSCNTF